MEEIATQKRCGHAHKTSDTHAERLTNTDTQTQTTYDRHIHKNLHTRINTMKYTHIDIFI